MGNIENKTIAMQFIELANKIYSETGVIVDYIQFDWIDCSTVTSNRFFINSATAWTKQNVTQSNPEH